MSTDHRDRLRSIRTFPSLIKYLKDELDWPITSERFEDLTFDYTPEELGIDAANAAKIQEIKRLRPLTVDQPWGIFFVKFEPKRLPVVALRRILSRVVFKKLASANSADRAAWEVDDLLFISNYGDDSNRHISLAHFSPDKLGHRLPTLKVLGWDNLDTPLHLDAVAETFTTRLRWPDDPSDSTAWRTKWRTAFRPHREAIETARDLSEKLAELARAIRDRINAALSIESETGSLSNLMKAFRQTLIHDLDDHSFADMYAQTIAYGLLSARIADPTRKTIGDLAGHMRTNPFLRELMEAFVDVGGDQVGTIPGLDFDELGVSEVVELLDNANMDAVLRDFGDRNPQEDPVIHFYEHFLAAYDKEQKVQRGVFYTPRPVVSFIVRSVDELLQTEFDLAYGLADTTTWGQMAERFPGIQIPENVPSNQAFVQVLDPATGTGTFLVEVIDLIYSTMVRRWKAEEKSEDEIRVLWNDYVPKHLLPRLHGYELLMAPYAIAHLKIGLKLYETGYRFGSEQRVRVYLTNSLEPARDVEQIELTGMLPALAHEAQAVSNIKVKQRFTVVVGNPPYSSRSQNAGDWINRLMERYKKTIKDEVQRQPLSNDYVKFMAFATNLLLQSPVGVYCMITDNSYLDGLLFRDVRACALADNTSNHIVDLGGNARKKLLGQEDKNVFDIQQGVAILASCRHALAVRTAPSYMRVLGSRAEKYQWLGENTVKSSPSESLDPIAPQFYFKPVSDNPVPEWDAGIFLPELFAGGQRRGRPLPFNGAALKTRHDSFAISFTRSELEANLEEFFSPDVTKEWLQARFRLCGTAHFKFEDARRVSIDDAKASIKRILYRPFDWRFVAYHPKLIGEPRPDVMRQLRKDNLALLSTRRVTGRPYDNVFITDGLVEFKATSHDRSTQVFPLFLYPVSGGDDQQSLMNAARVPNLEVNLKNKLLRLLETTDPRHILALIYAVLHSRSYRIRFQEKLEQDYPRIPVPASPKLARSLASLGRQLIGLHLFRDDLGFATRRRSQDSHLLAHTFEAGEVQIEKASFSDGTVTIDKGGAHGFHSVPEEIWNFHVGGYQVCYKWLKDRKGRTLSGGDIAHYKRIITAIGETIQLMSEIDETIEEHGGWPDAFLSEVEDVALVAETKAPYG